MKDSHSSGSTRKNKGLSIVGPTDTDKSLTRARNKKDAYDDIAVLSESNILKVLPETK